MKEWEIEYKKEKITIQQPEDGRPLFYIYTPKQGADRKPVRGTTEELDGLFSLIDKEQQQRNEIIARRLFPGLPVFDTPEAAIAYDEEIERRIQEKRMQEKQKQYEESAPARYWGEDLGTFCTNTPEQQTAKKAALDYVKAVQAGKYATLALLGNVGTGKTHLACGIMKECGGLYRTASGIVEELRMSRSYTAKETEAQIIARYTRPAVLILDEVGRGGSSSDEQYAIYNIINARYNAKKSTVFVSNFNYNDFINYIGEAVADRLIEGLRVVSLAGGSMRVEKRKNG